MKKNIPADGSILIKTFGNSMLPFFSDGDVLVVNPIPYREISVDDFVAFQSKNYFITHRVIYKSLNRLQKFIITKGDNNHYVDGKIKASQIIGKVLGVKKSKGIVSVTDIYFFQSTLYFQEILRVTKTFTAEKINFVILKGLPLHLYYEKKIPQRIYADCDILIDKNQIEAVSNLLKKLGYFLENSSLSNLHTKLKDKEAEIQFYKSIGGFRVIFDIHLEAVFLMTQLGSLEALYPQTLIDQFSRQLLSEKKIVDVQGAMFPILARENLLIYLLLHLFHHNFQGYARYVLIASLFRQGRIDFEEFILTIQRFRLENFIYPALLLLKKHYAISLPHGILNQLEPNKKIVRYIKKEVLPVNIFVDELRMKAGIQRFKYIYHLSPSPIYRKIFIFSNLQIIYSLFFIILRRSQLIFYRYNLFLKQKLVKIF